MNLKKDKTKHQSYIGLSFTINLKNGKSQTFLATSVDKKGAVKISIPSLNKTKKYRVEQETIQRKEV